MEIKIGYDAQNNIFAYYLDPVSINNFVCTCKYLYTIEIIYDIYLIDINKNTRSLINYFGKSRNL